MDDAAYLRAICWDPFDDGPRLVYADHLEELGECARAEFIRVQCELARLPNYEICLGTCVPPDFEGCPNRAQRRRELELLETHGERWVAALLAAAGVKPTGRQWVSAGGLYDPVGVGGRRALGVEFRRGLVGSVTLTAAQFFGGPCERCRGSGRSRNQYGEDTGFKCIVCRGAGHIEGVAAALFRAAPITEVRLSDREPDAISDGRLAWWYTDPDWHRPGLYQHHWLPVELRPHLTGRICEPIDEPRPGVCGFDYGDSFEGTDGVGLARADLSAACVAVGRARAELPALARPVSANFAS